MLNEKEEIRDEEKEMFDAIRNNKKEARCHILFFITCHTRDHLTTVLDGNWRILSKTTKRKHVQSKINKVYTLTTLGKHIC